jgi:hypothetical protein
VSEASPASGELLALLSRRQLLACGSVLALGALVRSALPVSRAAAAELLPSPAADATLQAFADTMIPGRPATTTDGGNPISAGAIAGVDPRPGAVEADALALYHHPEIGFDDLEPAFLAELEARSLPHGSDFLHLSFASRVEVCLAGLDFSNGTRLIWEAAAAVPFTAFCAAALTRNATWRDSSGYRVMGLPGTAPHGYRDYSYRRRLSSERTRGGSLP